MPITDPPFIEHLLLEQPWPLAVVVIVIGVILFIVARRSGKRPLYYVALASAVLAPLLFVLSSMVTTDREHLMDQTTQLVHATTPPQLR